MNASRYTNMGHYRDAFRGRAMERFLDGLPPGQGEGLPWTPPGLLVRQRFLDPETCHRWREVFGAQSTTPATVQEVDERRPGRPPSFRRDEQRITEFVNHGPLAGEIRDTLVAAYQDVITPHFDASLEWMSPPSVLKYVPGGRYNAHADSEFWDPPRRRWVRSMDRDYSLLLYVNDDYEGGALYFPNFDLRLRPARGMLVAFPSDHRYLHAAESLESGERYVVVCWGAVRGVEKVNPMPPGAIRP